uniref:Uncharacterized protein n=1 Tax=Lactuca sativa TaxID=4236 RepID=A0A9R1VZ60_LACSA|nr:hypothetical protein LSAT_V11C300128170 [Lactuca sativa]
MVKVSAYLLGEYSHLLARRPGCSPKDIFVIIHEKLPTDSNNIHSSLNIRKDFDALSTTRSRITKPDLDMKHALILRYNKELYNYSFSIAHLQKF